MKVINYIKKNGIMKFFHVIYTYKIELFYEKFIHFFTKNMRLKNYIIIESHNDFDCNGGAFYDYLVKNEYNKKYKIIWLLRKKVNKSLLPYNVDFVFLNNPSLKKAYYMCMSKYLFFDCDIRKKVRNDQISVYCSHGSIGLKKVTGKIIIPDDTNYILTPSVKYQNILAQQLSLKKDDKRMVSIGYPNHDLLCSLEDYQEISKITNNHYKKIFLWMPTFRVGISDNRSDSTKIQKLGIPLFNSITDLRDINDFLKNNDNLLIIKLHPRQKIDKLITEHFSNIIILTGDDAKKLNIDNYKLLKNVDALISDYSSIVFDFLQLDKPVAYVFDDIFDYKLGFIVDDVHSLVAGKEIYNIKDFKDFIKSISNDVDLFGEKRKLIRNEVFDYLDNSSCERLIKLVGIKK